MKTKFFIILFLILYFNSTIKGLLLIDNFNDGDLTTFQNKGISAYSGGSANASVSPDSQNSYGNYGFALKFTYTNSSTPSDWAGISIPLDNSISYTNFHYLSFFIKGNLDAVGDSIYAGIYDGQNRFVNISEYLPYGITTNYQKVVIPLDGLSSNLKAIQSINIVAEGKFHPGSGIIYIDNITFGTNFPGKFIIDRFSDNIKDNTTYGDSSIGAWGGSWITNYYENQYLKLPFIIQSGGGAYYSTKFGPVQPLNFSKYHKLNFKAKEESNQGDLNTIRIEINDGSTKGTNISSIDKNWQNYSFNLLGLGINTASLNSLQFVLYDWFGSTNGNLYIDEVYFVSSNYSPDTNSPIKPYNIKFGTNGLTNYSIITNGVKFSANCSSLSNDISIESVRFEYSLLNSDKWVFISEDFSVSNSFYQSSLFFPPFNQIFLVRVSAIDIYGNISYSDTYYCLSASLFSLSKTITNYLGGWLRNYDFSYINIPAYSLYFNSFSFKISQNYNGKSLKDFALSTISDIKFIGNGIFLEPENIVFKNDITIQLPIPNLPFGVKTNDLIIYFRDNSNWVSLPTEIFTDEFNNKVLKTYFSKSGIFIIGTKKNIAGENINYTDEIQQLYISEKFLTPNNDGYNDNVIIAFDTKLKENEKVYFKVINLSGKLIKEEEKNPLNNRVIFIWDGKDKNNELVEPDIYLILIKTRNRIEKVAVKVIK